MLDQVSKALVRTSIGLNETITIVPGFLDVAHVQNTGAAFGMLQGRQPFLIGVALVMLAAVTVFWLRSRPRAWPVIVPLGLVVGGALGNLYDRIVAGQVTDFLSFSFFAPVYNLADSAIVIGVGVLIVWVLFGDGDPFSGAKPDGGEPTVPGADGADVPASGVEPPLEESRP